MAGQARRVRSHRLLSLGWNVWESQPLSWSLVPQLRAPLLFPQAAGAPGHSRGHPTAWAAGGSAQASSFANVEVEKEEDKQL